MFSQLPRENVEKGMGSVTFKAQQLPIKKKSQIKSAGSSYYFIKTTHGIVGLKVKLLVL